MLFSNNFSFEYWTLCS